MRRAAKVIGTIAVVLACAGAVGCSGGDDDAEESAPRDASAPAAEQESTAERAPAGMVQVLMLEDVELDLEPVAAAVGTETTWLSLVAVGEVDEIGRGDAARQPAEGERFVVAQVEKRTVEPSAATYREIDEARQRGAATFAVQVDGAAPLPINLDAPSYTPLPIDLETPPAPPAAADPAAPQQRLVVVSVPEDAAAVDLVVTSALPEQRLGLQDGASGPENIAVLARQNRGLIAPVAAQDVSFTAREFGMSTGHQTQPIGLPQASLEWTTGVDPSRQTAGPGRALLVVAVDTGGFNLPLATELRLPDGTVVQPLPPADAMLASFMPVVVFDVPADFTSGTFVLGKDYTWDVPTGGTSSATFDGPVEYLIDIPATKP